MSPEKRPNKPDKKLDPLSQQAETILALHSRPIETPDFKARNLPGIWGGVTEPLLFTNPETNQVGLVFLLQPFPSMAPLLVFESVGGKGKREVIHNFAPSVPFDTNNPMNVHWLLQGATTRQNPSLAKSILAFMEEHL